MGENGDTSLKRGGRTQGLGNFIQGGGAGDSTVWVVDVGTFGGNGEEGGRGTHWVSLSDHGEAIEAAKIWDMGDAWGRRHMGYSRNVVGEDLHREMSGNRGSVGGAKSFIWGVRKGNRVRR